MQPRDVRVFLLDALTAAESIIVIRHEVGPERLRADAIVRAAIERHPITIGEALHRADGIDASVASGVSHLPAIVGLRNRLVNGYFAIEWSRIVALVEGEIYTLIRELRQLTE
jgi:uncharacterized protein with HEPN domain